MQGFNENYEKAITLFLDINLITEAAECLEGLEQYERVASSYSCNWSCCTDTNIILGLWKSQGQLRKAAMYFEKGGHHYNASECYHLERDFEQAVEVLRRGDEFDNLITYITEYDLSRLHL